MPIPIPTILPLLCLVQCIYDKGHDTYTDVVFLRILQVAPEFKCQFQCLALCLKGRDESLVYYLTFVLEVYRECTLKQPREFTSQCVIIKTMICQYVSNITDCLRMRQSHARLVCSTLGAIACLNACFLAWCTGEGFGKDCTTTDSCHDAGTVRTAKSGRGEVDCHKVNIHWNGVSYNRLSLNS